jgi:hypothetical protein
VHRLDAALLYRLALERAPAGSRLHAVAAEGVPLRTIASAIGRHLNVPVVSVPSERVGDHFGWLANFIAMDNPTSSSLTRKRVGWRPAQRDLLQDLEQGRISTAVSPKGFDASWQLPAPACGDAH